MSSAPPPPEDPSRPSFAEENAMRIASESLSHYDQASDTYHVSYGPPVPAVTVHDPERGVLVRVEPRTQQVVGFSIPEFKAWHASPRRGRRGLRDRPAPDLAARRRGRLRRGATRPRPERRSSDGGGSVH